MFNRLHSLFHDPDKGWDPISEEYAAHYRKVAFVDNSVVDMFDAALGGLEGKAVADVGSGPGHYAIEFARRGANVTCVDISATYLRMAKERMSEDGLTARYARGYIDHVLRLTGGGMDAIFSNVAWCYCMNDYAFAHELMRAVRLGGVVFTRQTNETWEEGKNLKRRLVYSLNRQLAIKLGHPHPPVGRIAKSFERLGNCTVQVEPTVSAAEIVIARRIR